jgi:hypothetical protein
METEQLELRREMLTRNLAEKGREVEIIERLLTSYAGEPVEGHSVMSQNISPAHLNTVTASSATAGSADGEPIMVTMIGNMSDVAGTGTPGPKENATPGDDVGGEECNLLGLDFSTPSTGEDVTGEDDAHQGEVGTHTESSSAVTDEFSSHQQPFSSVVIVVPPLGLESFPPVSPLVVQPATSGRSSSSGDKSEQGVEEVAVAALMTPSAAAGRQVVSDTGDVSTWATHYQPVSTRR